MFPQTQQAGTATLTQSGDTYTLSNALFSASFSKDSNGALVFDGCEAMNLKPGTPLFRITLGNGTTFSSNDMTLDNIETRTLTGNASAVKGSEKFNGKELVATLSKDNLTVTWHAVLRDGSHYLRTEMDITAKADQGMSSITPMIYNVDTETAGTAPVKVGNTRGAVLISDKIFAGLETPMGLNSAQVGSAGIDVFSAKSWNPDMFAWDPGSETPSAILQQQTTQDHKAITADGVKAARGYVSFRKAGKYTFTFLYSSGSHRLNIVGVDAVDGEGNVIASDYHTGYSGSAKVNNVYTLNVEKTGPAVLRYFIETITESVDSRGNITVDGKLGTPVVVYDRVAGAQNSSAKGQKPAVKKVFKPADSDIYDRSNWTVTVDGYTPENGCGEPSDIIDGDPNTYWHSNYKTASQTQMPHWFMVDMKQSQTVASLGFTTRQAAVDVNGHIKDYDILAGDDPNNLKSIQSGTMTYTLKEQWINLTTPVTARYVKVNIRSSQNNREFAAVGEFRVSKAASANQPLTFDDGDTDNDAWDTSFWSPLQADSIPQNVTDLNHHAPDVYKHESPITFLSDRGTFKVTFQFASGNNRLQIVGVDLLNDRREVMTSDYHFGATGTASTDNTYTLFVPAAGQYNLRYIVSMKGEANTSSGNINMAYEVIDTLHMVAPTEVPIEGLWVRPTTLAAGSTWNVSAVVGLVAPGQQRRSFLAYSERERAVPWRPMSIYVSWYELNIDRNNAYGNGGNYGVTGDYTGNYTSAQASDVLNHWKTDFFDKYHKAPVAFVLDDGWDEYGTWKFNNNFPNGFHPQDSLAKTMGAGIGTWLGPVGGYGRSGDFRRSYWSSRGGMQLSNKAYRDYFVSCCQSMINDYDFRFFKLDGISSQFSSVGPDLSNTGLENAEYIIQIERDLRKSRPDIFYNTSVGTWASPFWYSITDATWRQENDYGTAGVGTDREKWITYRDRLVYQNYVTRSPICPINTLMTHGLILSSHGAVSKDMNYDGIVREMHCAFGCGSSMVELYVDYPLMNSINNGALWKDLADCMDWQDRNKDVLPDIHWVGGNPWDGSKADIYGWASWNGKKTTLTLRNGNTVQQTLTTTLRKVFEIPDYIHTTITLSKSFANQANLEGVDTGNAIDIDKQLTITMPASTVYVFEGVDNGQENFDPVADLIRDVKTPAATASSDAIYNISGQRLAKPQRGINIIGGRKVVVK